MSAYKDMFKRTKNDSLIDRVKKCMSELKWVNDNSNLFISDYHFSVRNKIDLNVEQSIMFNEFEDDLKYDYIKSEEFWYYNEERVDPRIDGGFFYHPKDPSLTSENDESDAFIDDEDDASVIKEDSYLSYVIKRKDYECQYRQISSQVVKMSTRSSPPEPCVDKAVIDRTNEVREKMINFIKSNEQSCYKNYATYGLEIKHKYERLIAKFEEQIACEEFEHMSVEFLKNLEREILQEMNQLKAQVLNNSSMIFVKNTNKFKKFQLGQLIFVDYFLTEDEGEHLEKFLLMDLDKFERDRFNETIYKIFKRVHKNTLNRSMLVIRDIKERFCYGSEITVIDLKSIIRHNSLFKMSQCYSLDINRSNLFDFCTQLRCLFLFKCNIKNLRPGIFKGLSKLNSIYLDCNKLQSLGANTFDGLDSLAHLNLRRNQLSSVDERTFEKLTNLKFLDMCDNLLADVKFVKHLSKGIDYLELSRNKIAIVEPIDAFQHLLALERLSLSNNSFSETRLEFLKHLPPCLKKLDLDSTQIMPHLNLNIFADYSTITQLELKYNGIEVIEEDFFNGLGGLEVLCLDNNKIKEIADGCFRHLTRLEVLSLNKNRLTHLDKKMFDGLKRLKSLFISKNSVKSIGTNCFQQLTRLEALNLNENQIEVIEKSAFLGLQNLRYLDLDGNPIRESFNRKAYDGLNCLNMLSMTMVREYGPYFYR